MWLASSPHTCWSNCTIFGCGWRLHRRRVWEAVTYRITLKTLLFDSRHNLMGIKSGTMCYCGDDFSVTPNSDACTSVCPGEGVSECGSSTKHSIYNITKTQVVQSKKMFIIPYLFDFEEVPHLVTRSYHFFLVKWSFLVLSNQKTHSKKQMTFSRRHLVRNHVWQESCILSQFEVSAIDHHRSFVINSKDQYGNNNVSVNVS